MKTYMGKILTAGTSITGEHVPGGPAVWVREGASLRPLDPRLDLMNHSPLGFAWGYRGSGPAQLALAMLADATGDDALALELYQFMKEDVLTLLDQDQNWTNTDADVNEWVAEWRAQNDAHKEEATT